MYSVRTVCIHVQCAYSVHAVYIQCSYSVHAVYIQCTTYVVIEVLLLVVEMHIKCTQGSVHIGRAITVMYIYNVHMDVWGYDAMDVLYSVHTVWG